MDEAFRIRELESRVDGLEHRLQSARDAERNATEQTHALRADVARLTLLVESLRRVLVEAGLSSAADFLERVKQVDREDGIQDLQRFEEDPKAPRVRLCEGCRHFNPAQLAACQYCGRVLEG